MARRRKAPVATDPFTPVIEYYHNRLTAPAPPIDALKYPPVTIGPTWRRTPDGRYWDLPERTIGWDVLAWTGVYLRNQREPWRWTDEQARFILWWFATDDRGRFLYRDGVFQRLKGHGKDPLGAGLCAVEAFGPCRVGDVDADGHPIPTDHPDAWVQAAAVAERQTKNTFRLFPGLFTEDAVKQYGLVIGGETIYGLNRTRFIQAVTSNPPVMEGARSTFVLMNETHHWLSNNSGMEMAEVISRNTAKSAGGQSRRLRITNAFSTSVESVAAQDRYLWDQIAAGEVPDIGLMYDSLEAPEDAPLDYYEVEEVIKGVRGDSTWIDLETIKNEIADTRISASESRRFWYNQMVSDSDRWIDPKDLEYCRADEELDQLYPGDEIVLFGDFSKSDDSTALVSCRLSDGLVSLQGLWQKPPKGRDEGWMVNRDAVSRRISEIFDNYKVAAFWGDPSHTLEDESQERYWDRYFDQWHRKYSAKLEMWVRKGSDGHAIMWDMTSRQRLQQFTEAVERTALDIGETAEARIANPHAEQTFKFDGDGRLISHFKNAKWAENEYGYSIWKGHRESSKKIDAAVAAVGACMLRRLLLNDPKRQKVRTGRVY